LPASR